LYLFRFNDEMVLAAAGSGCPAAVQNRGRSDMTPAEDLVLAMAALLGVMVFVEGAKGTLTSRAGVLLSALAMLAVAAALVHMLSR
jgi:hypothetical protein